MHTFDASSMIHAWDAYPSDQFPPLWEWLAEQINTHALSMSMVAFEEVKNKSPECGRWLDNHRIDRMGISNSIIQEAMGIKNLLEIQNDNYHPKGVNENDILIIATAKINQLVLVSDENRQQNLPDVQSKFKIPAVCGLAQVGVSCINFIEYIKDSKEIFQ